MVLILGLLVGCPTPDIQPMPDEMEGTLHITAFINDGQTTRAEVLLHLGTPSSQFESQKLLTYQLRSDIDQTIHLVPNKAIYLAQINPPMGNQPTPAWKKGDYILVLVFKPNGILDEHSLVMAQ